MSDLQTLELSDGKKILINPDLIETVVVAGDDTIIRMASGAEHRVSGHAIFGRLSGGASP